MRFHRAVLSLFLVAIAVFLVSCSNPTPVAKGPVYTTEQLEQIQHLAADVEELRDRLLELPQLIQAQEWTDVKTFIHGPLGELRIRMSRLARNLEPRVQTDAQTAAKNVFGHLNLIDEAADARDPQKAFLNYNEALKDFDSFLRFLPADIG
jgi:photosystem II protein PsbQ